MELVSIIMPCFNNEATIKESINSVLSQSYKCWELIIINDNSTDDSQNIINDYVNSDERIKLITNEKISELEVVEIKELKLQMEDSLLFRCR